MWRQPQPGDDYCDLSIHPYGCDSPFPNFPTGGGPFGGTFGGSFGGSPFGNFGHVGGGVESDPIGHEGGGGTGGGEGSGGGGSGGAGGNPGGICNDVPCHPHLTAGGVVWVPDMWEDTRTELEKITAGGLVVRNSVATMTAIAGVTSKYVLCESRCKDTRQQCNKSRGWSETLGVLETHHLAPREVVWGFLYKLF